MEKQMKKLGFGTMRLPILNSEDRGSVDMEQLCRMVDIFLERGFTYFDTAYMYHRYKSELAVKEALVKRYPRDTFVLADKMPVSQLKQKSDLERIFEEQLEKCGVEYFDYYLLHHLSREHYPIAENLDAFAFIQQKKREGKAKRIGFSYHADAELLEQILKEHPEVEVVQLQLNYMDWESAGIQSRKCYEVCQKYGKDVLVMEPVKGGMLANVPTEAEELMKQTRLELSVASWAVRFAASQEQVIMVLSGMSNMEQLLDNTSYMQEFEPMNDQEMQVVKAVTDAINASTAIPCTACRYCVEGCPRHIPIPEYFALFNQQRQFGAYSNSRNYYKSYAGRYGQANDCIGCKKCERICPQHLKIVEELKRVSELFD